MFQDVVMGILMIVFLVWVCVSVLFALFVWPRIASHMSEINGLDKDSK